MKVERKYFLITIFALTILGVLIYQNCGGTQERTADFSISADQANAYLADVQCAASGGSSDTATNTAIANVSSIENEGNSEFFYSQAPSSMGDIGIVAPLTYSSLRPDGGSIPQEMYAFFALGNDGTASLVIGVSDNSGTASGTPSPTPAPTASTLVEKSKVVFQKNHRLDSSTPSATCSSSNPLNLTSAITAYNDGTMDLETASFDGDIFEMELSLDGTTTLRVRSYDVEDGDLQSTIQLEINEVDPNSGQEIYLGDINLTQPD